MDSSARFTITEAATKTGKTASHIIWLFERALDTKDLTVPQPHFWWVAPVYSQAKIAFQRLRNQVTEGTFKVNESSLSLTVLINGSVIEFKSADKPDNLYGEDVYAAVFDEFTRAKEDAWTALRTTLTATRGKCKFIGNVRGKKNWGYRLGLKARSGEPGYEYFKITAHDAVTAGILDHQEILDAQRDLPEAAFKQLYLAEALDDQANPFGISHIQKQIRPLSKSIPVCFGIDLAKSVDWTVVVGLDAKGDICLFERWQSDWSQTRARIIQIVGGARGFVDSTGVGDPIAEDIQKSCRQIQRYHFTSTSKQQLMEGLASAIQKGEISVLDGMMREELEAFEFEYTRNGVRYCIAPKTKILTLDLKWVEAQTVTKGQKLLAFDEFPNGKRARYWRPSAVREIEKILKKCYRINLSDGTSIDASEDHKWLAEASGTNWILTKDLRGRNKTNSKRFAPHRLYKLLDTWDEPTDYDSGYLAATFDGEGHLAQTFKPGSNGHNLRLSASQRENRMAQEIRRCLTNKGFQWTETSSRGTHKTVNAFCITGMRHEQLRFLGSIRPKRLLDKFDANKLGYLAKKQLVEVVSVEPLGYQEVMAISTTTKTLIAEGFASHNCSPEGVHDDCVMALGLARASMKEKARQTYVTFH